MPHRALTQLIARRDVAPLKILYVSAEVSPFAKVGGLADVAGSLPRALRALGHDVRVVMPAYQMVEHNHRWQIDSVVGGVQVTIRPGWTKRAYLRETAADEVPVYLLGTDQWFTEARTSETIYLPGADQHLFFARALLACFEATGWIPDVIHANDWHTGFIPVLMREQHAAAWDPVAAVHTIHNLAYQGTFGTEILDKLDLPHSLFNLHKLEAHGRTNFLKAGCVYADKVNTVSARYAQEIQTPAFGCGLDGLMRHLHQQGRLEGILNGIDTDLFNPATDPRLAAPFSAEDSAGKAICRQALLTELKLKPIKGAPLASVVSRLSGQKGFDLLDEIVPELTKMPMQVVILAVGDAHLAAEMRALETAHPKHVRFVERFDLDLAQRLYAGSDLFLMPSAYEPCGLGQLIALRYGTVPVVRETGGLADTVHEAQNGFSFPDFDAGQFLEACRRAHAVYGHKPTWNALVQTGLSGSYGWDASARKYEKMYERAMAERRAMAS